MLLKTIDKTKKILCLTLVFILLCGSFSVEVFALTASQKEEYKDKISEIKQEIKENEKKINALNKEAATYKDDVNSLQKKIDALQKQINLYNKEIALIDEDIKVIDNQINEIQKEVDVLNQQIEELDAQVLALEQEKADTYTLLGERIRASYMSGHSSSLEYILTSDDFEFQSYLERVELLYRIAEHDDALIKRLEQNIEDINKKLTEIEDVKSRLSAKIAELDAAKAEYEAKKKEQVDARNIVQASEAEIQKELDKVKSIVNKLNKESKKYKDAIDKREDAIAELEDKLEGENRYYGSGATGKMVWPVPYEDVYISSSFKLRTLNGRTKWHKGVDICRWGGSYGSDVIASKGGTVTTAAWGYNGGYGNYIVINHGNGVCTYYAHLSDIKVKKGQKVKQGLVIGKIGNTGYSFGAHLHFGVMINGKFVDPVKYVPRYTPKGKYIKSTDKGGH